MNGWMEGWLDGGMDRWPAAQHMLEKLNLAPFLPSGNVTHIEKTSVEPKRLMDALVQMWKSRNLFSGATRLHQSGPTEGLEAELRTRKQEAAAAAASCKLSGPEKLPPRGVWSLQQRSNQVPRTSNRGGGAEWAWPPPHVFRNVSECSCMETQRP